MIRIMIMIVMIVGCDQVDIVVLRQQTVDMCAALVYVDHLNIVIIVMIIKMIMMIMIIMIMKITIIMKKNDLEGNMGSWTTARSTKQRRRICLVQPLMVKALNPQPQISQ